MNIFFWILVVLVLVLLWFCLSSTFDEVGSIAMRLYRDAADEIKGDESEDQNECEDDIFNEQW